MFTLLIVLGPVVQNTEDLVNQGVKSEISLWLPVRQSLSSDLKLYFFPLTIRLIDAFPQWEVLHNMLIAA